MTNVIQCIYIHIYVCVCVCVCIYIYIYIYSGGGGDGGGGLFCFLGTLLWHMEFPRLGVESKLQLLAIDTATQDLSHDCDLHHSSQQAGSLTH